MKTLLFLLIVVAAVARAQAPPVTGVPADLGHVTGSVHCQDTGLPGRFASIQLLPEQELSKPTLDSLTAGANGDPGKLKLDEITAALKSAIKNIFSGSDLSTLTALDGSFQLQKVPPGTYFVIAQLPGYLSPLSALSQRERVAPTADTIAAIASQAQKILVRPGQNLNVLIDLNRGATLSGTVAYSDGSPAPSIAPTLLLRSKDGSWKPLFPGIPLPAMTDNNGVYRFYGLAPGDYAVKAALPTEQSIIGIGLSQLSLHQAPADALVVYSGGSMRESDLKPIEVGGAVNLSGIDLVFPLQGLHTISGSVLAESDHHGVNDGALELQDPATKSSLRTAPIGADGSFQLHYVPDGDYVLKVTQAADRQSGPDGLPCAIRCKQIRSYASTAMAVHVKGDLHGLVLSVVGAAEDSVKAE
jgi:hypothetical protein